MNAIESGALLIGTILVGGFVYAHITEWVANWPSSKKKYQDAMQDYLRGHRKTPPNRYTLAILFAFTLTCSVALAEDGPRLSETQYAALRAAVGGSVIDNPDPDGVGNYRRSAKMTADGVIVAIDSRKPGITDVSYVPGDNAAPASDVLNNQTTQAAIANMKQMSFDLAVMKRDTQIINEARAQGKAPDQEFRDAFEKAEQAAIVAAQQPAQARIVQPKELPAVYEARKPLVSLEKKES